MLKIEIDKNLRTAEIDGTMKDIISDSFMAIRLVWLSFVNRGEEGAADFYKVLFAKGVRDGILFVEQFESEKVKTTVLEGDELAERKEGLEC